MKQISTVRKISGVLALILFLQALVFAGIGGKEAAYIGGTVPGFNGEKDPVVGELDTSNNDQVRFLPKDKKHKSKEFSISYQKFIDIEYGQKAGRRVGAATAGLVLLGPIGLIGLFSKKRKHYVTIGYKDAEDKDQVAVIEVGKDIIRTTLSILETRSGKKIEYQDKEAEKAGKGN
ncbi:MAG: hypothetical protein JNM06_15035 [Blastocatellia bacterium]|nr:hypothetical protein [Blastocatellia bacterium]